MVFRTKLFALVYGGKGDVRKSAHAILLLLSVPSVGNSGNPLCFVVKLSSKGVCIRVLHCGELLQMILLCHPIKPLMPSCPPRMTFVAIFPCTACKTLRSSRRFC